MADRQLKVTIVGDTRNLDRALGRTETRLSRFGSSVGGAKGGKLGAALGGGLGGVGKAGLIGAGVAAGAAVALKVGKSVAAAAKEAQVAQANLDQAFAASGKSQAKYGAQVETAIQATSRLAAIDDELVSDSYASLLRTTGSVEKATRGVALAANIARARKISLAAAAKIVEKAENGQLRGLRALGVEIDANTTATEAIERAQAKFAGSSERYGRTAAGAQDKLAVAFENLQEKVGAKLLPVLTRLTLKLVELVEWSEKNWPKFSKDAEDAYRKVKPILDAQIALFEGVGNAIAGMVRIVHGVFTGDWAEAWKGFKQYAVDGVGGVVKAVASLPLKIGKALGDKAFAGIERVVTGSLNRIIDLINKMFSVLGPVAGALGKFGIDVRVPKIPHIGGSGPSPRAAPAAPSSRPEEGGRPVVVQVQIDGKTVGETTAPHVTAWQNKAGSRTSGQSRGRSPGRV